MVSSKSWIHAQPLAFSSTPTTSKYSGGQTSLIRDHANSTSNSGLAVSFRFELIPQWYNYLEPDTGFGGGSAYAMRMFADDGTGNAGQPKSIMNLVRRPPQMLPTTQLHQEILNAAGADS